MPLFLSEETLEFPIGDAVILYERLRYEDADKIRYLCDTRGMWDDATYNKVSLAVAIKGWRNLAGQNGLIAYPMRLPADKVTALDADRLTALMSLYPGITDEERQQLHGRLYVVDHMPMDIFFALLPRIKELEPDALKKKWLGSWNGASPSSIPAPDVNIPVMTVVPSAVETGSSPSATPAA